MKPSLVILAAGLGSRYGGLKQLDPIGPSGETLMDYSIFDAMRAGFERLVFVIRRDIEKAFREKVGQRFEARFPVAYCFQDLDQLPAGFCVPAGRAKPWGTGHAVLAAKEVVNEPFAVINADDFYGRHSFAALAAHLRSGSPDMAMVGYTLRNTLSEFGAVARGLCQMSPGGFLASATELTRIEKQGQGARHTDETGHVHPLTGDEIVSLNLWGFLPSLFAKFEREFAAFLGRAGNDLKAEFYIPAAINSLVKSGEFRVKVLPTSDSWLGITYREDLTRVISGIQALVEKGDYPVRLL